MYQWSILLLLKVFLLFLPNIQNIQPSMTGLYASDFLKLPCLGNCYIAMSVCKSKGYWQLLMWKYSNEAIKQIYFDISVTLYLHKKCNRYSLMNQTLWSQGAYRLEIISAWSERVWSTAYTNFVLRNRQILSIVDWCQTYLWDVRIKFWLLLSVWKWMTKGACVYCHGSCCIDTSQR